MEYYAHTWKEDNEEKAQGIYDHLTGTALIAKEDLACCGLGNTAYLAGLLHDMGKCTQKFQNYLLAGDMSSRGSVIHSFQGCRYVLNEFHDHTDFEAEIASEIIAYAIAAHHGQFDCINEEHNSGFRYRTEKENIDYLEAVSNFYEQGFNKAEIKLLFKKAKEEIIRLFDLIDGEFTNETEFSFEIGLLTRMVLSAVIDGDRQNTAMTVEGKTARAFPEDMRDIWKKELNAVEEKLNQFINRSEVDAARRKISDICRSSADRLCGIYRLNVPTGGGKTLSSLRYALAHANKYNKKRIIFTSPLLSILEQNARVIHEFISDEELILEHHSNIVMPQNDSDTLNEKELWLQSWNAPIIITTLVQLLNTLFDGKTSSIRRFNSLCNSIIVIDEVQTVPSRLITMFNLAIRFLSAYCGATIILCSATQPRFDLAAHPLAKIPEDIVPYDKDIWSAFERTTIEPIENARLEDLPSIIINQMENTRTLLVVCNTKDEASYLLENTKSPDWKSVHLSAGMCMQHRRDVVKGLYSDIDTGSRVLCISTQVIEAGVDISFEKVIRLTAGLDSIIQAAGRCNRNGESETPRPVYAVNCTDEKLGKLEDIVRGKNAVNELFDAFKCEPDRFDNKLSSDKAISFYYKCLYREMNEGLQDYYSPKVQTTLFDLLSWNKKYIAGSADAEYYFLWQAFKTAGQLFNVFDENTTDIIVPYGGGKKLISELNAQDVKFNMSRRELLLKQASAYTVSVYDYQRKALETCGAIIPICDGTILTVLPEFYDDTIGLKKEANVLGFWEV